MTLITAIRGWDGIVMAADTEEVIPEALRSSGEKLHVISDGMSDWKIVVSGSGHVDYIGMARDFIQEKAMAGPATDTDILKAIRESIHEIWRDYARYEPGGVDLKLLIGSWSSDRRLRLTVTAGAAVRDGRSLEAWGGGDATFRALADRFLMISGPLSCVGGELGALRIFTIYAMQQAMASIPGVGGSTRLITLRDNGKLKWEKSWAVAAWRNFFNEIHGLIGSAVHFDGTTSAAKPQDFFKFLSRNGGKKLAKLLKELDAIENDSSKI